MVMVNTATVRVDYYLPSFSQRSHLSSAMRVRMSVTEGSGSFGGGGIMLQISWQVCSLAIARRK
jgi:hypothetical protein